jgi:dTDP-4-dehydrorhamnose reductase
MKNLVLGAKGTLGSELVRHLHNAGEEVIAYDHSDLDVTQEENVKKVISELKPDAIFNCVAYNAVDKAEEEPEVARKLNVDAVRFIAEAAKSIDAVLVQYSSGFIFDGASENGYAEDVIPNPKIVYGETKYEGEQEAVKAGKYYVVRLNLLFGPAGSGPNSKKTFPDLISGLAENQSEFNFVTDEVSTPTYSSDLSEASIKLVKENFPYGVYHLVNEGQASWYDYAEEVFRIKGLNIKINPIKAEEYKRPAERPHNSVLINTKFPKLRPWQIALEEYLKNEK